MAEIRTVTATTTESSITFECFYPYVWIRNLGESDVYAANYSGIVAGAVDVSLIKSGEVGMVQTQTDTIYVKATGTTTLECRAQGYAECPFKRAVKGGVIPSITVEPLSVSVNGTYTAPTGSAYSPVTVDVQEQPWQPLEDGYSNFWFELTNDTLSPWLNFSAKTENAVIDWGDGSGEVALDTLTPTHTYAKAGKYVVKVKGVTGIAAQTNVSDMKGDYAFVLKNVEHNSEVTTLASSTYRLCVGLENIVLGANCTNVAVYSFDSCSSLRSIELISGITRIYASTFSNCYNMGRISIPNGVTAIEQTAFTSNYCVKNITIPSSVEGIGNSAFAYCRSLNEIHVQATNPPTTGTTIFGNAASGFIIYVPVGTAETYKSAAGWSTYADHILEEGQTLSKAALRRIQAAEKNIDESEVR